jgi:hypothetical protein
MSRAFLVFLLLASVSASAQDALPLLKPADRARIESLGASREKGLAEAAAGKPDELRAVKELLALETRPVDPPTLEGRWRCRALHLGGIIPLTINPFFECRIRREGSALVLEKSTGGTRRKARLAPIDERRLLLYGTNRAASDPVLPYGTDPYRDEVGILERVGPDRLRIEMPQPRAYNTASHEVFELVRAR